MLFLNHKVICAHPYRVMRNADLTIDEEDAADLLKEIQKQLKKRQWGQAIRLEVEAQADKRLLKIIKGELAVAEEDIYRIDGPLDLTFLMKMYGLSGFDHLKEKGYAVKNAMAAASKGCTCPPDFPVCICGKKPKIEIITRKPLTATEEELAENNRSHSAKLRIAQRI